MDPKPEKHTRYYTRFTRFWQKPIDRYGYLHENPSIREMPEKLINKGFIRLLEGYGQEDKNLFHLPRQYLPNVCRSLYLSHFRALAS